ncbi:uracil-DNA glycosylase [Viridibacterium curvum]|uniref:Type-4 uracil-DNA glycosylase n=1 Tax=Viridibacterium curvum TaxID=1101404 RepID=A0ABP9QGF1_9RHOO
MSRTQILAEMGIKPVWRLRQTVPAEEALAPQQALPDLLPVAQIESASETAVAPMPVVARRHEAADAADDWAALAREVAECRACKLCETRKQAVLGVGDTQASWMLVGEGPGAEEDERGEPFVGQAGKLLDAMLGSVGLTRGKGVYIANSVKCRPPGNRTPTEEEILACRPFLERQIRMVQPHLLIALGRPAAQTLLGQEISISAARGRTHRYGELPVLVTYHPAYLLRTPQDKAKAWEDLCRATDLVAAFDKAE